MECITLFIFTEVFVIKYCKLLAAFFSNYKLSLQAFTMKITVSMKKDIYVKLVNEAKHMTQGRYNYLHQGLCNKYE